MTRTPPTKTQLDELATVHLYYEVAMLRGGEAENRKRRGSSNLMRLDRADPARIACMSFFEAALMHARVLDDFLTQRPGRYKGDIWAGDYITNWTPPKPGPLKRTVSVARGRGVKDAINKQLAHLSLERLQQTRFFTAHITNAVAHDMRRFASDTSNICYAELGGVRTLLALDPWPTI